MIKGYKPPTGGHRSYAEDAILELFSKEEIDELKTYFEKTHKDFAEFKYRKERLPYSNNIVGIRAIPRGWTSVWWRLCRDRDWPLNFEVEGHCDVDECDPSDIIECESNNNKGEDDTSDLKKIFEK